MQSLSRWMLALALWATTGASAGGPFGADGGVAAAGSEPGAPRPCYFVTGATDAGVELFVGFEAGPAPSVVTLLSTPTPTVGSLVRKETRSPCGPRSMRLPYAQYAARGLRPGQRVVLALPGRLRVTEVRDLKLPLPTAAFPATITGEAQVLLDSLRPEDPAPLAGVAMRCLVQRAATVTRLACQEAGPAPGREPAVAEWLFGPDGGVRRGEELLGAFKLDGRPGFVTQSCGDGAGCDVSAAVPQPDGGQAVFQCTGDYVECGSEAPGVEPVRE